MKYLFDVNALLACLVQGHVHHSRARRWIAGLTASDMVYLTPWVEVAFLRVGLLTGNFPDMATGQRLLAALAVGKAGLGFLDDDSRAADLPPWAKTPVRLGDGHLFALAHSHGMRLATFDQGIPGVFLVP